MQIALSLTLGVVGFGLLWLCYFALKSGWPLAYVALSETYALTLPQRLWRLLLFRILPTFMVSLGIVVSAWRLGLLDWVALSVAVALHLSVTNVWAIIRTFRGSSDTSRVNHAGYHASTVIVVALTSVLAATAAPWSSELVPRPSQLIENLWTGAFVAAVGAVLLRLASLRSAEQGPFAPNYFMGRVVRDVGIDTLDEVYAAALRHGADPLLLKAVLATEVLQRPRWFRRLENLKGRFLGRGTYGVMQVQSASPISDDQSIDLMAAKLAGRWAATFDYEPSISMGYFSYSKEQLWAIAGELNGDVQHIKSVDELFAHFSGEAFNQWSVGTAAARLIELRRFSASFSFRGMATGDVEINVDSTAQAKVTMGAANASGLRAFAAWIPPDAKVLSISVDSLIVNNQLDFHELTRL